MMDTFDIGTDDLLPLVADELAHVSFVRASSSEQDNPGSLLHALAQTYRDVYQETVEATGIDPIREADAARSLRAVPG